MLRSKIGGLSSLPSISVESISHEFSVIACLIIELSYPDPKVSHLGASMDPKEVLIISSTTDFINLILYICDSRSLVI